MFFSTNKPVNLYDFDRIQDLTVEQFYEVRNKAGGLVILLPECLSKLSAEQRQVSHICTNWIPNIYQPNDIEALSIFNAVNLT